MMTSSLLLAVEAAEPELVGGSSLPILILVLALGGFALAYVLVGPGDPPRAPGGLAERLATCAPDAGPPGFERVWASPARDGSGPACALWAVR